MSETEKYTPTDDEAACAATVARRRNSMNGGQSNIPGGETASESERFLQHYVACLAEIACSRVLNLCWSGCGKGANGGFDVGDSWQIRAITERHKGLLVRPKDDVDHDFILVFVDNETRECELLGWAPGHHVMDAGKAFAQDTDKPYWVLSPDKLDIITL